MPAAPSPLVRPPPPIATTTPPTLPEPLPPPPPGEAAATATELLRATTAGDDAVAEVDLFMGTDPSLPCNILAARLADEAARVSELLERFDQRKIRKDDDEKAEDEDETAQLRRKAEFKQRSQLQLLLAKLQTSDYDPVAKLVEELAPEDPTEYGIGIQAYARAEMWQGALRLLPRF